MCQLALDVFSHCLSIFCRCISGMMSLVSKVKNMCFWNEDGLDDNECFENNVSDDNELKDEEDYDNEVLNDEGYHETILEDGVEYVVEINDANPLMIMFWSYS